MFLMLALLPLIAGGSSVIPVGRERISKVYAIVIGVDRTRVMEDLQQTPTKYCAPDAQAFGATLKSVGKVEGTVVLPLLDEAATDAAVRDAFSAVAKDATPSDVLLVFFSGRSFPDADGTKLLLADTRATGKIDAFQIKGGLTARTLADLSATVSAGRQVFIIDSCNTHDFQSDFFEALRIQAAASVGFKKRNYALLTAACPGGESFESPDLAHGFYTTALLKALSMGVGKSHDLITLRSVVANSTRALYDVPQNQTNQPDGSLMQFPNVFFSANFDVELGTTSPKVRPLTQEEREKFIDLKLPLASRSNMVVSQDATTILKFALGGAVTNCTVNGQPARADEDGLYVVSLPLKLGVSDLQVVATTTTGESIARSYKVDRRPRDTGKPMTPFKTYALIVGIGDYKGDSGWQHLPNPVGDAKALADLLHSKFGISDDLLTVLPNATRHDIRDAIKKYQNTSFGPDDQLLVFFAGHGFFDSNSPSGLLVAADSDSLTVDKDREHFIPHSFLRDNLNIPELKHVAVILDSCYSGTFGGDEDKPLAVVPSSWLAANLGSDVQQAEPDPAEVVDVMMKAKAREYLTSGGKDYVSDGEPGHHSPFTARLLEVLSGVQPGGVLTFEDLISSMHHGVKEYPRGGTFGARAGVSHFVFVANKR